MTTTVVIQIGNTDNKLTQREWASFAFQIKGCVQAFASEMHFFGGSANYEEWQNVACIALVNDTEIEMLRQDLKEIRQKFRQDSVAWTQGRTEFV